MYKHNDTACLLRCVPAVESTGYPFGRLSMQVLSGETFYSNILYCFKKNFAGPTLTYPKSKNTH